MKKVIEYIVILLFAICFSYICYQWGYKKAYPKIENNSEHLYHQIDSLNQVIDNINSKVDSLQCKIDTTKQVIVNINKDYEEKYIDLSNAPLGEQLSFFSEYLSEGN